MQKEEQLPLEGGKAAQTTVSTAAPAPEVTAESSSAPVVEIVEDVALMAPGFSDVTIQEHRQDQAVIDSLLSLEKEQAVEVIKTRTKLLRTVRKGAISSTQASDWIKSRDRHGIETAMVRASGSQIILQFYGIHVFNLRPQDDDGKFAPEITEGPEGEVMMTAWFDAYSSITKQQVKDVRFSRSSVESFIGGAVYRGGQDVSTDLVKRAHQHSSLFTGCLNKAARLLGNANTVSMAFLKSCGIDPSQCIQGSGYGTSTGRTGQRVAEAGAADAAEELWKKILASPDVGGDFDKGRDVLKAVTANPPKFGGFTDYKRLTQGWQIEQATKNLNDLYKE